MLSTNRDEYPVIQFEETELRLGLPLPGGGDHHTPPKTTKRGFSDTGGASIDLKLNLSTAAATDQGGCRRLKDKVGPASDPAKPPSKAQVVGWPPVRSYRKNTVAAQKKAVEEQADQKAANGGATSSGAFVKVSMDGAPYLRKVDLKLYKSYQELSNALGKMFSSFTIGDCGTQGMKDFMNESKLIDLLNGSDYVATYEDKDGDWMLVGDVPWMMFVDSCKRLRIMKGSEAIGLAPRAVEKCKSRS